MVCSTRWAARIAPIVKTVVCVAWVVTLHLSAGALPENHREERLSGSALGALHHPEWR